jgi:aminotransferase EvaB
MQIRYFAPGEIYKKIRDEMLGEIDRVLSAGDLIMRKDLEVFEERIAKFLGVKYFVGVNSGTDALYLALLAVGIGKGDEVITTSHTFIATIEAIVRCGATPILVDIDDYGLMDIDEVIKAITPKTKCILPVHLTGDVVCMDKIMKLAEVHNLIVIEDAAQALGASVDGKMAGSWGLAGCFSFYPAKILGAYGDAGGVATDSEYIYREVRLLRNHYNIKQTGLKTDAPPEIMKWIGNSRLDNLQAAILNVKFKYLTETLLKRWAVADMYNKKLQGVGDLVLPPSTKGRVWQDYVIRTARRDKLKNYLQGAGIETLGFDLTPNHLYKGYDLEHFNLPKTEKYLREQLRIPCNENMSYSDVEYVIQTIKEFYN